MNGFQQTSSRPAQSQSQLVFRRMSRYIGRVAKEGSTDDVHKFRTNSRRIEAVVSVFVPENGNQKKLLKSLAKLRKKAGKVRDLDVQIAFLKDLRIPDRQNHRTQLMDGLELDKARRKRKLAKALEEADIPDLRKRLRKASNEMRLSGFDLLRMAHRRLPNPGTVPLSENALHACRIEAKRARYLAELAPDSEEKRSFIDELKKAQDAIGEWHDVLKLKERAEKLFGGVQDSSLVAALQNISRARFRRATSALTTAISALSGSRASTSRPVPPLTLAAHEEVSQSAAA